MILVTGGNGFIGSNFVIDWINIFNEPVVVIDKMTYAGNVNNLDCIKNKHNLHFVKGDINDQVLVNSLLETHKPRAVLNFAAESHVDRSIHSPQAFIDANICGTFALLEMVRQYWNKLPQDDKNRFRYLQVSTDEVYGSLEPHEAPFTENSPYSPNNPYSASKAAADHLVRSYFHTYGLPTLITNCSNNYGPYQFPEKLIPFCILNALQDQPLCVYGDGLNIRDWLFVTDHCAAIREVLARANVGETFNIGGNTEKTNIEVVQTICRILDKQVPRKDNASYTKLITYIKDRPGHDRRYAIDASKIRQNLDWQAQENFDTGIQKTITWYLNNLSWIEKINKTDIFQSWLNKHYSKAEQS